MPLQGNTKKNHLLSFIGFCSSQNTFLHLLLFDPFPYFMDDKIDSKCLNDSSKITNMLVVKIEQGSNLHPDLAEIEKEVKTVRITKPNSMQIKTLRNQAQRR